MTTTHGLWHGDVVVEDRGGVGLIPLGALFDMAYRATQRDASAASWGGRSYDRDVLNAAADTARTLGLDDLPTCTNCHDAPGTHPMGDGHTFCETCCSGAAGSHYDDKD